MIALPFADSDKIVLYHTTRDTPANLRPNALAQGYAVTVRYAEILDSQVSGD
jgi:hypothetical protein